MKTKELQLYGAYDNDNILFWPNGLPVRGAKGLVSYITAELKGSASAGARRQKTQRGFSGPSGDNASLSRNTSTTTQLQMRDESARHPTRGGTSWLMRRNNRAPRRACAQHRFKLHNAAYTFQHIEAIWRTYHPTGWLLQCFDYVYLARFGSSTCSFGTKCIDNHLTFLACIRTDSIVRSKGNVILAYKLI